MRENNITKLSPVIIAVLAIGLMGTGYLYFDASADLAQTTQEYRAIQNELRQFSDSYNQLADQVQELSESNTELEAKIAELETGVTEDIILDISDEGDIKNIILLIGDGMGPGQVTAAETENGDDSLFMTGLPYKSWVTTYSSNYYVTDSAASATALATGFKTKNMVIGLGPDGEVLTSVVEVAEENGWSTGIV